MMQRVFSTFQKPPPFLPRVAGEEAGLNGAQRKGRLPYSAHDLFGAATSQVFNRLLKV